VFLSQAHYKQSPKTQFFERDKAEKPQNFTKFTSFSLTQRLLQNGVEEEVAELAAWCDWKFGC